MITIIYTNGNIQNITPGGSFYSTVVEKKRGTKFIKVQLDPSEWRKNILDVASDIAFDCSHFDKRACPVAQVNVRYETDNLTRTFNQMSYKEEFTPRAISYKKEQKKLRKLHKNDKLKTIMHFCVELN